MFLYSEFADSESCETNDMNEIIKIDDELSISKEENDRLVKKAKSSGVFWEQLGEVASLYCMYRNAKSIDVLSLSEKCEIEPDDDDIKGTLEFRANDYRNYVLVLKYIIKNKMDKAGKKLQEIDSAPRDAIIGFLIGIDKGFNFFK